MPPLNVFSACKACRRLKRKCSGDVPACSLCIRLRRVCEYVQAVDTIGQNDAGNGTHGTHQQSQAIRNSTVNFANFPPTFFLEPESFQPLALDTFHYPCPSFALEVSAKVSQRYATILEEYSSKIHSWLPILSIKRLRREIHHKAPKKDRGSLTLLFLCLELLSHPRVVGTDATSFANDDSHYATVKRWAFEAETSGFVSLDLVQSLVFLGAHELGHAIYPAAYSTIGRAARLGGMMGLHDARHSVKLFVQPDLWTGCEEQRRTWWAILMLDRMAVVGSPSLLLAAPEPGDNELLPSHDSGWTQGSIGSNEALLTQAFHPATSLGPFAKTCQAVHMLGKVLRHYNIRNTTTETKELVEEALALHRALLALDSSLTPEVQNQDENADSTKNSASYHDLDPAIAICSISRLILYNQYACNVPNQPTGSLRVAEEAEAQAVSLHGIQVLATERIAALATSIVVSEFAMRGQVRVQSHNPILGKCFYHAATECAWFVKEDENGEAMLAALKIIIAALRVLETEWGAAGNYLELLTADGTVALADERC